MVAFMVIGSAFAVLGSVWPTVRRRLTRLSALGRVASNYRFLWLTGVPLAFVFVDGPDIYRRATLPPTSPPASPTLSINPLQDDSAKWRVAQNLAKSPFLNSCDVVIVQLPTDYAERLGGDLKRVLDAIHWKTLGPTLASAPVPRGLSLRSEESGPSHDCANALFGIMNASGLTWQGLEKGGNFSVGWDYFPKDSLGHECFKAPRACVRISVGNEPQ
jgi:hypothetical protein